MSIQANSLHWKIGSKALIDGISLSVEAGETIGLLGPNGSGKSSLLRVLSGLKKPNSGSVVINGQNLSRQSRKSIAKQVAFVQQHASTELQITVRDSVKLGRTPHRSALSDWKAEDQQAVTDAIQRVNLAGKESHIWNSLSGGERQRVQIARALAQKPSILFLDEPTNHLDIQHQLELLALIKSLDTTNIIALHDLNLAAMFCDRLVVLEQGKVIATGTPTEVLTEKLLRTVFRVNVRVDASNDNRHPTINYLSAV